MDNGSCDDRSIIGWLTKRGLRGRMGAGFHREPDTSMEKFLRWNELESSEADLDRSLKA